MESRAPCHWMSTDTAAIEGIDVATPCTNACLICDDLKAAQSVFASVQVFRCASGSDFMTMVTGKWCEAMQPDRSLQIEFKLRRIAFQLV